MENASIHVKFEHSKISPVFFNTTRSSVELNYISFPVQYFN